VSKDGSETVNIDVYHDGKGFILLCGCPHAKFMDMHPIQAQSPIELTK